MYRAYYVYYLGSLMLDIEDLHMNHCLIVGINWLVHFRNLISALMLEPMKEWNLILF